MPEYRPSVLTLWMQFSDEDDASVFRRPELQNRKLVFDMIEVESGGNFRRSLRWIRKAGFTLSKLCAVSVRALPIENPTIGWARPTNGRGLDDLAISEVHHRLAQVRELMPPSSKLDVVFNDGVVHFGVTADY